MLSQRVFKSGLWSRRWTFSLESFMFLKGFFKIKNTFIIQGFIVFLAGCAVGGTTYGPINKPLFEIRKAVVKAFPVAIQNTTKSTHEFRSIPFVRYGEEIRPALDEPQRAYALVYIRGRRRPYTLEVLVPVEEAENPMDIQKNYRVVGYDKRIATIILTRLKAYLTKYKEDPNVVDGLRAF